jgi:hypothetical protein
MQKPSHGYRSVAGESSLPRSHNAPSAFQVYGVTTPRSYKKIAKRYQPSLRTTHSRQTLVEGPLGAATIPRTQFLAIVMVRPAISGKMSVFVQKMGQVKTAFGGVPPSD